MADSGRWEEAQQYEKAWWQGVEKKIKPGFYEHYARKLESELQGILAIQCGTRILEVGSGAAGIVTFLESDHKYAVDPLEEYYGSVPAFTTARDPRVRYAAARGEELPFDKDSFDLVITDNVLDHCESPQQVVSEMHRVLAPGGILYLRLNVYHAWGRMVRQLAELAHIDKGHPHTFTSRSLRRLLTTKGLELVSFSESGYWPTWRTELTSGSRKDLLKAMTFATRNKTTYILRKA